MDWPTGWRHALSVGRVPGHGAAAVTVGGIAMLVVRAGEDDYRALGARCPDCGAAREPGRVSGRVVACDGCGRREALEARAGAGYPVLLVDGEIYVHLEPGDAGGE